MVKQELIYWLSGLALVLVVAVFLGVGGLLAGAVDGGTASNIGIVLAAVVFSLAIWWRWIFPRIREQFQQDEEQIEALSYYKHSSLQTDDVIRELSDAGWVLVNDSGGRTSFTRDGLTLLIELVEGELVLSGTGVAEAEVDLDS